MYRVTTTKIIDGAKQTLIYECASEIEGVHLFKEIVNSYMRGWVIIEVLLERDAIKLAYFNIL